MDEPQRENPEAVLEALLFVHGEPVSIATLAKHAGVSEVTVREKLVALEASYAREESGLALLARRDEVQLVTKPAMGVFIERMVKDERQEELTPASLETLAIIAYLGPVERHVVDYIRGVNSQVTLRNLQVRGLIEKKSNPRHPITPLYETTFDFLANLGLRDASALPEFERYQTIKASLVERSSSEHA